MKKKQQKRKKLSSLLAASVLGTTLLFPTSFSAESSNSIHTSVKSHLNVVNSNKISSKLKEQFKTNDQVTFLIKMKEQVNAAEVAKKAESAAKNQNLSAAKSKLAKRSAIVSELRLKALDSQYDVREYLKKQVKAGNASNVESFYIVNAIAVKATKEVMEQIALMPEVEKVLPNETRQLIQPVSADPKETSAKGSTAVKEQPKAKTSSVEWNISQISAPQVWEMGIDGAGTVVASIDTGVQWDHPSLKEKYRGYNPANPSSPDHEFNWFDATSSNASAPFDDIDHGTHVTGTMVGSEPGGANQIGVAPGAKFIAVKAFTSNGGTDVDLLEAGEWILAPKDDEGNPHPEKAPDVVNNSWGGGAGLDEWFRPMVQTWKAAEIFPEFSAGNTTLTNPGGPGSVANPANYPESYATGATDINNKVGSFSLRGPSPYGEIKPDISAPGVNIRSAVPGSAYEGGWNGTSMAGPHVSAVVALLKQVDASLTVDEIEEILETTATPLTDSTYPTSPNHGYGHGLVNAFDAVSSIVAGLGEIKGAVTKEGDDSEAPTISHEPATQSYKGMDLSLSATATDNVSVSSVTLKYKKADGTWVDAAAERKSGDYKSGTYEATIPGSDLTGDSVEYKFVATDFGGNRVESNSYTVELLPGITVGYNTDFEGETIGWTSFGTKAWELGTPTVGPKAAFSGEKVFATNLSGTYTAKANMSLKMPPIDLPEGNSYLQFKHWFDLEKNYDFGHVFISTDGTNWTQLARFNQTSNGWVDGEVDLSAYAGQRIYINFNMTSDGSVNKQGWFIDDVKLSDTAITPTKEAKAGLSLGAGKDAPSTQAKPKVDPNTIKPDPAVIGKEADKEEPGKDQPAPMLLPIQAAVSVLETGRSVYTSPQDGSYKLTHAAGAYTVKAEAYGFQSQTQSVNVAQDGTSTANFTLQETPSGTISGKIVNEQTGQPIEGATVFLVEDAAVVPVLSDAAGEYSMTAYEGTYTLKISAPSFHSTQATVTVEGGQSAEKNIELKPFIGYAGEIKYDDGTAENARAFNAAGNSWAVKMSLEEGQKQANVTGALFRFWNTEWPNPGGTEFQVSVYDASGSNGTPGKKLAGPFNETALRDGTWTHVDLSEHGIMVDGDFFIVYTQTKANPNAPGLATDEDGPNAKRSYQGVSGAWSISPEAEGNYMIRATVNYEVTAPGITSPVDGSFTNKEEVTVEGTSAPKTNVDIYNDGEKVANATTTETGTYSAKVTLKKGANTLTAKVTTENGSTDASAPVTIVLDQDNPALAVTSPANGSKTNKESVTVTGTIADDNLDSVQVNGQNAKVADGKFSLRLLLEEGINEITVVAKDKAGNEAKETRSIDVKYTAPTVSNLVPATDKTLESGESVKVEFDSEAGLKAEFSLLLPLTNAGNPTNAIELPMKETSPGHYVGYYTATKNVVAPGAGIEVKISDNYGNVTTQRAEGKLYINAPAN
ncbi:MAG: S8 family serine peptidase [Bacillus sp. (in: firmicutes)]